jgi:hypothetical protein
MFGHHTKNKGDIGVLKVKADLASRGYAVGSLDTEHCPFDIVAYKDKTFTRIQVKYRASRKGFILVQFKSSWSDKNGLHETRVDKTEVDLYAVYCPDTDCCYYFNPAKFNKTVTLRLDAPRNNQVTGVNLIDSFRSIPEPLAVS